MQTEPIGSATMATSPGDPREALLGAVTSEKLGGLIRSLPRPEIYDWATVFPKTTGVAAQADIRRRARMLLSLGERWDFLLYPGERVEFVTKGILNSFAEQYFMGLWAIAINRTLFLFTNYRVVLVQSDSKGRAKTAMWQIPYQRLAKYGSGLYVGSTSFKTNDGRTFKFAGIPRADRKRLRAYVSAQVERAAAGEAEFPGFTGRDALCPTCGTPVPPKARACAECGEEFINPIRPALMSLVVPGLGDLYLGHRGMALFELAGFALLLLIVGAMISASSTAADVAGALVLLAVANLFDGAITLHVARKAVIPTRLAWKG